MTKRWGSFSDLGVVKRYSGKNVGALWSLCCNLCETLKVMDRFQVSFIEF